MKSQFRNSVEEKSHKLRLLGSLRVQRQTIFIWTQSAWEAKYAVGIIFLILMAMGWIIYKQTDRPERKTALYGELVGIHQIQDYNGSLTSMWAIRLRNGKTVLVDSPTDLLFREHAMAEVDKVLTQQGGIYYSFIKYTGSANSSASLH